VKVEKYGGVEVFIMCSQVQVHQVVGEVFREAGIVGHLDTLRMRVVTVVGEGVEGGVDRQSQGAEVAVEGFGPELFKY
jgi:hypothetical protein